MQASTTADLFIGTPSPASCRAWPAARSLHKDRSPVYARQNVLLSQHGFIRRSPPRKQPGGRREPQRALRLTHFPGGSGILYTLPGFPANGARREAERERRTGQGHWRGGNMPPMPRHSRPIPTHNAQESSDRAACAAGSDRVFVPSNGVITFNLNRLPGQKKTEALQYQRAPFRTSWLKKAVIRKSRDSCFVFRVS